MKLLAVLICISYIPIIILAGRLDSYRMNRQQGDRSGQSVRITHTATDATDATEKTRELQVLSEPIEPFTNVTQRVELDLYIDPPENHFAASALGVFLRCTSEGARVYYTLDNTPPTRISPFVTYDSPYVHINTPFRAGRYRVIRAVATETFIDGFLYRSEEITRNYIIEASERPWSYGFLVPGLEGGGYFARLAIESAAEARAQLAGGQEFADFNTSLGIGTYADQLRLLHLPTIDPDLIGFEGGFAGNTSTGQFGYLVPYHNGNRFFGKLVRVNLFGMENETNCMLNVRFEWLDSTGTPQTSGVALEEACIVVLNLESIHEDARGFRKGFIGYPYGFISPGQYDVAIRINVEDFGIHSTQALPLRDVAREFGGYSGGFRDGSWACLNPFRSFFGPIGGVRSDLEVDRNHLRTYHHAVVVCINDSAWGETANSSMLGTVVRSFDLGDVQTDLRGFSEAIRVGRFAYLAPFASGAHTYSYKLVRINLGVVDIIHAMDEALSQQGGHIRDIIDVLDLTQKDPSLAGFSGIFTAGKYLYLVPWRSSHEAYNGQRGHGLIPRVDMNIFDAAGIDVLEMPTYTRSQIPSFPDSDLRGFSGGFASGSYGVLIPFFNGIFSGKVGRLNILDWNNVQEVDLTVDRNLPGILKGFRGGFVSEWQGTPDDLDETDDF
mmetsp:Transcript_7863/g.11718  ORF Transcript_7863/g.11718 Transcript_7863/m.11718 type:complete len:668 (+) Transcript_7863:194-2197(+)|eukprot:CAMPEP_0185041532 /NCGR_PEP_ID=MMETSP1103-20130426/40959_1 /TAXON_ID=36769 /ORGANISM="Paraphysomonas bandaiensis, Strain Caron Lab Isolate" /LENGTH=667 /DNA_ID=CAMNT_0027581303 /DNA_START=152 /DNA_END=2155 /DNA_ORIENTATION=+